MFFIRKFQLKFIFQVQYGLESKRNEVISTGLQKVWYEYLICNFTSKYEALLTSALNKSTCHLTLSVT